GSAAEQAIADRFARAWQAADIGALVALLTDDAFIAMPPMPFEYAGRDAVADFCARLFGGGRRFDLVPTRANRQPAFGAYLPAPPLLPRPAQQLPAMPRFDPPVPPFFGLPPSPPSR